MCTLAIYYHAIPEWPVIVAANRDEFLERPTVDPTTLLEQPHVVGGKDLRAGGTWLGISEFGLIAGLLNRRASGAPNPVARSRGLLCLDALSQRTIREAVDLVRAQCGENYNPFNLLLASRDEAWVACNRGDQIELIQLKPGLHMLSNLNVNDPECPKISRAYQRFAGLAAKPEFRTEPVVYRHELAALLADHSTQLDTSDENGSRPNNALCLHLGNYGTRSSSLIFVGAAPERIEHFFAPGPPCTTGYSVALVPRRASAANQDSR